MSTTRGKRGSLITEAAIILPLFILAIAALIMLTNQCGKEEKTMYGMVKAADIAQSADVVIKSLLDDSGQENILPGRTVKLNSTSVDNVYTLFWLLTNKMPGGEIIHKNTHSVVMLHFRPFVGESEDAKLPDEAEDDSYVYIFPKYGEKYHKFSCSVVDYQLNTLKNYNIQMVKKSYAETEGYKPCSVCFGGAEVESNDSE